MKVSIFLPLLLPLLSLISPTNSARILSISFLTSKSHKIVYEPLLYALGERGHNVTIMGALQVHPDTPNVRNIKTYDPSELEKTGAGAGNLFNQVESTNIIERAISNPFLWFFPYMEASCHISYQNEKILNLLKEEKFDIIVFPPLWNDCMYGLIHKLNTSTVLISQMAVMPWVAETLGTPTFPAFTPLLYYGHPRDMTFLQRTANFMGIMYFHAVLRFYYFPRMEAIYRNYLGHDLPGIRDIQRNASLVLSNSHFSFNPPRPLLPDIVEVGGMHLRPAKPLPKDLDDFLNGGKDGCMLFSMGSFLQGSAMPEKTRQIFINVFAKLKLRVLWKWETETMEGLPPNVKLSKWLPQQDVLGHKNMRVFLTHGGFGSTMEALYEGVPLVGIPMFADQASNMKQAEELGFTITLQYDQVTEETLMQSIKEALEDPKYRNKAQELSRILKDQPDNPLDRAVFWVEYVLRHGGAPQLKSNARDLNVFQYFSLDVILFLLTVIVGVLSTIFLALRRVMRMIFGSSGTGNVNRKGVKGTQRGKKNQ